MPRGPEPAFRIWVAGRPQSGQKRGSNEDYTKRIREAAAKLVPRPTESKRVDVEVWFCSDSFTRADVDNVLKPVLDALNGVVYHDDRQVRSVRAVAIPNDDAVKMTGWTPKEVTDRLGSGEFLINVFGELSLPRDGP
jgi:Holliday junction resolvase RusA-like endonuclease